MSGGIGTLAYHVLSHLQQAALQHHQRVTVHRVLVDEIVNGAPFVFQSD